MAESKRPIRLSKAAKEFNISLDTLVEFLTGHGFTIDRNPNFKLDQQMYSQLAEEFEEEKHVREVAAKKGLEYVGNKTITIEDVKGKDDRKDVADTLTEDIIITSTGITGKETEKPATRKSPVNKPVEPVPVKETKVPEEKAEKEKPAETEPVHTKQQPEKEKAETTEEEPLSEEKRPKVVGKVDLESMNMRTRPKKQTREQKKKKSGAKQRTEKKEAPETGKPVEKKPSEPVKEPPVEKTKTPGPDVQKVPEKAKEKEDNFIPTKVEKLTGPKVVDKISLPAKPKPLKKKPVASSSDQTDTQKKKKRRRIKSKVSSAEHEKVSRTSGRKSRKKIVKAEPTQEEIQKQIKETLARLAPSGKSKASKHRRHKREHVSQVMKEAVIREEEEKSILKTTEFVTANELATMMDVNVTEVIKSCMQLGLFVSINQRLDAETIVLVAEEFSYHIEFVNADESEEFDIVEEADNPEDLEPRAPIVTIMGHVDHGKTKLLDYIRKSNIVAGEAGGITQHIGAYEVTTEKGRKITFLDTPGHEAFTAMRARGAKVTDIAIIVIAADDSVMPQTKEAINHAQAAGVPTVFAFNKMDKPGANADKIREQLSAINILVEEWGGKYQSQEISAITGAGIDDLLEKVLLEAEMLELKANPNKYAKGTVIEASLDKGRGYVATILVQDGTLHKGDIMVAGPIFGKVKAMFNERKIKIDEAGPSVPALLLGLNAAPQAGELFMAMPDEKDAKNLALKRQRLLREQSLRTQKHITLEEIGRRLAIGDFKELNIIVKGDVDGSVEALSDALLKLSTEEVQVNFIHKAVGAITESDVMLASASDAIIIGFQVRPVPQARKLAEKEQIDIRLYSIIYQATEEIADAIKGMLTPKMQEKITSNIEVRDVFKITKVGTVAGCYVLDGKITRNTNVRLIRDGIVVYTGKLGSLKRFKDDVKEVASGYECGLNIENFNDIKVGDIVEGFEEVEV
ncbi:MAG TPA: translation initiation factor IF-2 [Bacteroidetes bacterium]|nr:translation initiation factor IF-2 [Bacteroidota bacterium]